MPEYFGKDVPKLGFGLMRLPKKELGTVMIVEDLRMGEIRGFEKRAMSERIPEKEEGKQQRLLQNLEKIRETQLSSMLPALILRNLIMDPVSRTAFFMTLGEQLHRIGIK